MRSIIVIGVVSTVLVGIALVLPARPYLKDFTQETTGKSVVRFAGEVAYPKSGTLNFRGSRWKLLEYVAPFEVTVRASEISGSQEARLAVALRAVRQSEGHWDMDWIALGGGWLICFLTLSIVWFAFRACFGQRVRDQKGVARPEFR